MESHIAQDLEVLEERLGQLCTLLEWRKLHDQERPIAGLPFRQDDPAPEEVSAAYGSFISVALDLQRAIDQITEASLEQQRQWRHRLRQLLAQCDALQVPQRFINR